ncbi:MAG: hypothetical protein Fur0012_03910 [Elusimicrobiota bacterium]
MWFMNGKNDLESSALMDINQLELAGSNGKINIVVQLGRMKGQEGDDSSDGDWTGVRRYFITRDTDTGRINSPVVADLGKRDMGSWKELSEFIVWVKNNYPAERYALMMWDHGNGWKPIDENNWPDFNKGFSLDEETGKEISLPQLSRALKSSGNVDFILLDGCNMAMASVAYELKDRARVLVASEETEPGVVIRYSQIISKASEKKLSPEELGYYTVAFYRDYFEKMEGDNEGAPATQSALRLYKMDELRRLADEWVMEAFSAEPQVLSLATKEAKIFGEDPDYKDLCDFVSIISAGTHRPSLKSASDRLLRFIKNELVIYNWAQDYKSYGLSIYVPSLKYEPKYSSLSFSRDGLWDEFASFLARQR